VLGTPPAFVLSQDQTLRGKFFQTFIVEFETWLDYLLITSILAKVENSAKIDLWLCTLIVKEQHSMTERTAIFAGLKDTLLPSISQDRKREPRGKNSGLAQGIAILRNTQYTHNRQQKQAPHTLKNAGS
jgi:hypothetical protein